MMFSEERVLLISNLVVNGIWKDDLVDYANDDEANREAKRISLRFFSSLDSDESIVRQKIQSLKKPPPEGGRDWDILYDKYMRQHLSKEGR